MPTIRPLVLLSLLAVLGGCTAPAHPWAPQHQSIPGQAGRASSPATPAMPVAPDSQAVLATGVEAPVVPVEPAAIITNHTGRALPTVTAARGAEPVVEAATAAAGVPMVAIPDEDDPPALAAYMAAEDPPSYNVDDRTPYNVVIAERSAHSSTIAWHTEVPTKGILEYGRAWGFDKNGYTHKFTDDVAKTDHQIALTDLRRWTGYVYRVTAVTPLGLKFPEQERKFRTKFWSWR